jgi:hypothetical protein
MDRAIPCRNNPVHGLFPEIVTPQVGEQWT